MQIARQNDAAETRGQASGRGSATVPAKLFRITGFTQAERELAKFASNCRIHRPQEIGVPLVFLLLGGERSAAADHTAASCIMEIGFSDPN